jgi:hypothetical protein
MHLSPLRGCIRLTSINIGIDSCSIVMERLLQPNETTVTLLMEQLLHHDETRG